MAPLGGLRDPGLQRQAGLEPEPQLGAGFWEQGPSGPQKNRRLGGGEVGDQAALKEAVEGIAGLAGWRCEWRARHYLPLDSWPPYPNASR